MWSDGDKRVELVDLPSFGRVVRLVWHKRRWRCKDRECSAGTVTEQAWCDSLAGGAPDCEGGALGDPVGWARAVGSRTSRRSWGVVGIR